MLRKLCLLSLMMIGCVIVSKGQLVKEFKVTDKTGFDIVALDFTSYKSTLELKRYKSTDPIYIHGHLSQSNILPVFSQNIENNVLKTSLIHKNIESENLGKSITSKFFSGSNPDFDHSWNINLSSNYLYEMDFTLGIGNANFDLANLTLNNFKVNSTSADVQIGYSSNDPNQIQMDTVLVTLNMGTIGLSNINYTNAKKMIFEVNYGKIDLNFSEGMSNASQVVAAVGAGSIYLHLPPDSYPIKINIKKTPMCKLTIPKSLKSIENGTYVSKGYKEFNPNLLELTIDVGVGSLTIE